MPLAVRTKSRPLPAGDVSAQGALWFGVLLLPCGLVLLSFTTVWAFTLATLGWISYVLFYTPLKHYSAYSLFVGAIAGATPIVVGYTAASNSFDLAAVVLFVLLYIWQLPHFLAISVYRFDEYAAAGVPLGHADVRVGGRL